MQWYYYRVFETSSTQHHNLMNLLLTALVGGGLLALLFKVAIICIIVWGIFALLAWAGVVIPSPIRIILICLGSILAIYWLFELFGAVI